MKILPVFQGKFFIYMEFFGKIFTFFSEFKNCMKILTVFQGKFFIYMEFFGKIFTFF